MNTRYAISDIHGNYKTFLNALDDIQLSPSDELYILGDYIDRGPASREVINHIMQLQEDGYKVRGLVGNHETYMLRALASDDSLFHNSWLRSGGGATLNSYRINKEELHADIDRHVSWLNQLPYFLDIGDYLLVHAGFDFKVPNPIADKRSMILIRNWYQDIDRGWLGDLKIVHGHTPMSRHKIEAQLKPDHPYPAYDIDAGCFHYDYGYGHLCVMNLDLRTFSFYRNVDMNLSEIRKKKKDPYG